MTYEVFFERAIKIHGDKYDYSKVKYVNGSTKVCIICPEHGEFWQTPQKHLCGQGCPKCGGKIKLTTSDFIEKAREIHGDKYDYSKVEYINNKTKICIICPEHGEFWQLPSNHLSGKGCTKCGRKIVSNKMLMTNNDFIRKSIQKHNGKYSYEKTDLEQRDKNGKVIITCPIHGDFLQTPSHHILGNGCPLCKRDGIANRMTKENDVFINEATKIHGGKYDYSKVNYINAKTKVCIICPEHGEFWQTPSNHLKGRGCSKCNGGVLLTTDFFKEKALLIHNGKYSYEKTDLEQRDKNGKVIITCPIHGDFWQTPSAHLRGQGCDECNKKRKYTNESFIKECIARFGNLYNYDNINYINAHTKIKIKCNICNNVFFQTPNDHLNGRGCPICKESKLEKIIRSLLENNKINFVARKKFEWLGRQHLDFYLPDYNIAIECQGIQHFQPVDYFGGKESLEYTNKMDKLKLKKCQENGIKIIYFTFLKKYDYFFEHKMFKDKTELLNFLKNEKRLL